MSVLQTPLTEDYKHANILARSKLRASISEDY